MQNNRIIIILLLSLSISPAIFLGEGNRNLLLIGVMSIIPIFFLKYFKLDKIDIILLACFLLMLIGPYFTNIESYRISTILYSIMFGFLFITYKQILYHSFFTIENFIKLIKYIIYAYLIVLIIQQFCVLTGLPIFNISNYSPAEPFKLNSLSAEPSHTVRIVALLMFTYIILTEIMKDTKYSFLEELRNDKLLWFAFLWIMLTSGSATGFLFLAIIFMKFLQIRNIVFLFILTVLGIILLLNLNITSFQRTFDFTQAVLTLDIYEMMSVDHSASMRIAPLFVVADRVEISTLNGLFGNGIDSTSTFISSIIHGIADNAAGGGFFQIWYEYGFIIFILFVLYTLFHVFDKNNPVTIVFWFFLVFLAGINSQMVWLCIFLLFTIKFYKSEGLR